MKDSMLWLARASSLLLTVGGPLIAYGIEVQTPPNITTFSQLMTRVCNLMNVLFTVLVVIAVIFVLFAAYRYLTAAGEAEKVKSANYQLLYAGIAIVIAILARGAPVVVANVVGGETFQGC